MKQLSNGHYKNLRRVCKSWNEQLCDTQFVFRYLNPFEINKIAEILLSSSARHMDLEFQYCFLQYVELDSWKIFCPKIRSLYFRHCKLNNLMKYILPNCIGLENFMICEKYSDSQSFLSVLDHFLGRNEQHTCLKQLAVELHPATDKAVPVKELLRKIFTVFPNIVNLSLDGAFRIDEGASYLPGGSITYDIRKLKSFTSVCGQDILWSENQVIPILDFELLRFIIFVNKQADVFRNFYTLVHLLQVDKIENYLEFGRFLDKCFKKGEIVSVFRHSERPRSN